MTAPIRIEAEAFSDARFVLLAAIGKYADADHARSKVEWIWAECTRWNTYHLPAWIVEKHLGRSSQLLVDSDLAEWCEPADVPDMESVRGLISSAISGKPGARIMRIKGCVGRVEWYEKARKNTRKGGKARALSASRVAGRFAPASDQPPLEKSPPEITSPLTLTLTPTLTQICEPPQTPPQARPKKAKAVKRHLPADWTPTDAHRTLASQLGVDLAREQRRFCDHAQANGRTQVDWDAAFRTWLDRSRDFTPGARGASPAPVSTFHKPPPPLPESWQDGPPEWVPSGGSKP